MIQKIRASQFITTYGPGSIVELPEGPVIIPNAKIGLFDKSSNFFPNDYQIQDDRMSKGLLDGANIYRLPTNSENALDDDYIIYKTKSFPMWHLCQNQAIHQNQGTGSVDILYQRKTTVTHCPICGPSGRNDVNPSSSARFVRICKDGHLDEVDWHFVAHTGTQCSRKYRSKDVLIWKTDGGSALRNIIIECPQCQMSKSFSNYFYNEHLKCTGREPETEQLISSPARKPCEADTQVVARQASNIRMPEIKTLLSIQSIMTKLHRTLERPVIKTSIRDAIEYMGGSIDTPDKLERMLEVMNKNPLISQKTILDFKPPNASFEEVQQLIADLDKPVPTSYHELILDEFRELNKSSVDGAPPHVFKGKSKPIFEVLPHKIKDITTKKGTKFKITPVSTLQTITVQTGFKRDDVGNDDLQSNSQSVSTHHVDEDTRTKWYPGASYMGEGIFIRLDGDDVLSGLLSSNPVTDDWLKTHNTETNAEPKKGQYPDYLFRDAVESKDELHPGFVWWHTLSHLLIRIISEESGYSSSAIRERIYFNRNGNKIDGGILLYAAQPGSEGTLGGLTALVPHFKSFLDSALDKVISCSGDPLCSQNKFNKGKSNGVCCDVCLMNSETSCEHRNMWLDRKVLMDSIP